jgi:hypothetical protein
MFFISAKFHIISFFALHHGMHFDTIVNSLFSERRIESVRVAVEGEAPEVCLVEETPTV